MDISLALMCGIDIPIPECQLTIHQPKIKEIAFIGEKAFFSGVQLLCINKNTLTSQDKTLLNDANNFQIFMTIISSNEGLEKKEEVKSLLSILFPEYNVIFTPRSLLFSNEYNSIVIDADNFLYLQKMIATICCLKNDLSADSFNPYDAQAQRIAEKILKGRQRVAAQKQSENKNIFNRYLSVLTIGLNSMSLFNLIDLTIYQLYDLMDRYSLYLNWDIDLRSRLAGAKNEKQMENWMKDIH